jgi:hypothetical protein
MLLMNLSSEDIIRLESGVVQLFVEAQSDCPRVFYLPSLGVWSAAVSETA